MKITRRELLISAGSLLAYSQLGSLANAEVNIAAQPGDQEMIASMCKALYPHDRFPMSIYMDVAAGAIKKGNADTGAKICHTVVALYDHKEVHKIFGYQGASFDKGGYKDGEYNDLSWLPEPRIEEHPDLTAFLDDSSPKKYASLKIKKTF